MDIAVFSKTGVYLLHEGRHCYRKSIQTIFASYKDIIIIPVPSKPIMNEERLNLLKKHREKIT